MWEEERGEGGMVSGGVSGEDGGGAGEKGRGGEQGDGGCEGVTGWGAEREAERVKLRLVEERAMKARKMAESKLREMAESREHIGEQVE